MIMVSHIRNICASWYSAGDGAGGFLCGLHVAGRAPGQGRVAPLFLHGRTFVVNQTFDF